MSTFFSASFFVQHLTALLGTLGFAVLFKVRARHLPLAGACGLLTWLVYYTVTFFGGTLFLAAFLASAVATVFAECCARVRRADVRCGVSVRPERERRISRDDARP